MAGVCHLATVCLVLTLTCVSSTQWSEAVRGNGAMSASLDSESPTGSRFQDQVTQKDRRQFLASHNAIRAQVGATNMVHMVWSWQLEKLASSVIQDCGFVTKLSMQTKRLLNTWFSSYGLNAWNGKVTKVFNASVVVDHWAKQKAYFDFQNLGCAIGEQCMNYAQIVWSTASHVGCSLKYCRIFTDASSNKAREKHYALCVYGEGGSKLDDNAEFKYPYIEGEACTNCPTGFWMCVNGLCQTSPECETVVDCLYPSITDHCLCSEDTYSAGRKTELSFLFVWMTIVVSVSIATCLGIECSV